MNSYRAFPTDADFLSALQTSDLYNFRRRSYFLRVLENYGRKEHVTIEDYSIEHIMPQNENLSEEWQTALGPDWQDVQHRLLHTLGNLTSTGYNSEYSDHAFTKKRDMEGGFRDSPLRLNKGLGTLDTWNAEQIEARADRLAKEAVAIWSRPSLSDDVLAEFQAQGPDAGFSIEDHPNLRAPPRRALFEKFSTEVLALDRASPVTSSSSTSRSRQRRTSSTSCRRRLGCDSASTSRSRPFTTSEVLPGMSAARGTGATAQPRPASPRTTTSPT